MPVTTSYPGPRAWLFGLPRLATAYCHTSLFILTLPLFAQELAAPSYKGLVLGFLSGGAACFSILLVLAAGAYADRCREKGTRLAKRRNQVAWGLWAVGGAALACAVSPGALSASLALAAIMPARTLADTASLSLLSEHPGIRRVEHFSSAVSIYHFLGSTLGAATFGMAPLLLARTQLNSLTLAAFLALLLAILCWMGFRRTTMLKTGSEAISEMGQRQLVLSKPILLFMASRIFFLAGMFIVPTFLIYMVQDLMQAPDVRMVASWFVGLTLLGAAAFAWPAARAIGKFGEVKVLLYSGSALALAAGAFVLGVGWSGAVGYGSMALYGVASGFVMTAGISLNMKLVPLGGAAGRIMALVAASTFLSQLIASMVGGVVLDQMNRISPGLGYYGLLVLLLVFMASGCRLLIAMEKCGFDRVDRI